MDESFRDQNAEESAAALLHACKQFKDEALSSFLPRYQRLLVRSPSSSSTDKQKSFQLSNALNQITQNYMIGRDIPDRFVDFVKYLSIVGSQVERVGMVKTRVQFQGQVGTLDNGIRGIAGGKLLGGKSALLNYHTPSDLENGKDVDWDTRMTGVYRIRAKWVSQKEIDQRLAERACLRCGKRNE